MSWVQGLGFGVQSSGFNHDREAVVGASRLKSRVEGLGLRVQGLGFSTMIGKPSSARDGSRRVPANQGLRFRVKGLQFRV